MTLEAELFDCDGVLVELLEERGQSLTPEACMRVKYVCTVSQATVCRCRAMAGSRPAAYFRSTGEALNSGHTLRMRPGSCRPRWGGACQPRTGSAREFLRSTCQRPACGSEPRVGGGEE